MAGAIGKPPPRARRARNSNLWRLCRHPSPPSAERRTIRGSGGWKIRSPATAMRTPTKRAYPQSSSRLTTPSAEEAKVVPFHSINTKKRQPPLSFFHPHAACPRRLCQPPWTHASLSKTAPHSQAEPTMPNPPNSNASRSSGGSAREGKDSHSRQWRLSMAVFLNRNKRPQAAPIEVAELLSEKPPPSHTPNTRFSLRKGARGRGFSLAASPGVPLFLQYRRA